MSINLRSNNDGRAREEQTEAQTETLADLEICPEQTEQLKGGGPVVIFAVNGIRDEGHWPDLSEGNLAQFDFEGDEEVEEIKNDKKEQEAEPLNDLQVSSENSEEVKGGGSVPTFYAYEPNFRGGVFVGGD